MTPKPAGSACNGGDLCVLTGQHLDPDVEHDIFAVHPPSGSRNPRVQAVVDTLQDVL